ncbi:MAG: SDR family oxidoreductase [Spirochaetes bacterium]|nr:SDR family oxidoreductase [Spirochaetota bacterium]
MKEFSGKTVFITGGSSGIGLASARLFAKEGAHIAIFARDKKRLDEAIRTIEKMRKFPSQKVHAFQCDVANFLQVQKSFAQAERELGICDVLINCAGRAYPAKFEEISLAQCEETMRINFFGIWNTCAVMVPRMKQKGGVIVNTSSVVGFLGVFGYTDYAASKFAIIGFSEALRSEVKQYNIHVAVLCPPDTDTPGFEIENKTKPQETKEISKSAKLMTPEDVAKSLLNGIKKNKTIILPNFESAMTYYMKRFAPSIVDRVMDAAIRRVHKQKGGQR